MTEDEWKSAVLVWLERYERAGEWVILLSIVCLVQFSIIIALLLSGYSF